jgi:hypothetical protein
MMSLSWNDSQKRERVARDKKVTKMNFYFTFVLAFYKDDVLPFLLIILILGDGKVLRAMVTENRQRAGNWCSGEWRCKIQPPDGSRYQLGIIALLTSEQGFVRDMRLPRHVVPSAYSLTLTPFIVPDNYTIQGSVHITATTQESENKCDSKVKPVLALLCLWGWGKGVVVVDGSKLLHWNLSCRRRHFSRLCYTCKISCKSPVSWIIAQPITSWC